MADLDKIIAWENGEMTQAEEVEFFQELVDTGMAWRLQGMYGRNAARLIEAGLVTPDEQGEAIHTLKQRKAWTEKLKERK